MSIKASAKFLDGPAEGRILTPDNCPIVLRVAVPKEGEVEALRGVRLDARSDEAVVCYLMDDNASIGFWDGRDRATGKRTGGQFVSATYRLLNPQPPEEAMRTWAAWSEWCRENETHVMKLWKDGQKI